MTHSKHQVRALIVDDEADIRELIEITLSRMAIETVAAPDLATARTHLQRDSFDLCLTDMRLPDGSGIDLVRALDALQPGCPIAVITAYGNAETAVASLKAGAFDFVAKPIDVKVLRNLVNQALKLTDRPQPQAAPESTHSGEHRPLLIGETTAMQRLRGIISKLARSQAPIYITGESGTGKELVARSIHGEGPRADAAFVPVNCGAIPAELMESELFGYRKGAFTGANSDRAGLVQQANGGTLFLDEVAELPLAMQVKLLRLLQERTARPIGDTVEHPVDIRIISATHRNLAQEVAKGRFREDLFYRLNVIEVIVPPLRERRADIALLAQMILARLARQLQLASVPQLAPAAMDALLQYRFPGNVRELENMLERAVTLSDGPLISPELLRLEPRLGQPEQDIQAPPPAAGTTAADLESQLQAVERERIRTALQANKYNKTQTAKALGITFRALRYRMAKLGLE